MTLRNTNSETVDMEPKNTSEGSWRRKSICLKYTCMKNV